MSCLIHFFIDFGIDFEAQMALKTFQNSIKNQSKIRPKKTSMFRWILAWNFQRFVLDLLTHFL